MIKNIVKRDGKVVPFQPEKIQNAVMKAFRETNELDESNAEKIADIVRDIVIAKLDIGDVMPNVENIQEAVENALLDLNYRRTAKSYIAYRAERTKERLKQADLMQNLMDKFNDITHKGHNSQVTKGDAGNANVDTDGPMGKMLQFGSEASKSYAMQNVISRKFANAHKNGDIHIHDLDFLPTKTLTCCQINLEKLFNGGFSTGHGYLREPQSIGSYAALAAIALQANQNQQHKLVRCAAV